MKLKNLTIGKIKEICKSKRNCPKTCPLKDHQWCCLGLWNMTTKELESEITIKQPQRKYYVGFTKHRTFIAGNSGMTFQDNCGFCVKDLNSERIKRPFYEENTIVENLIVKENKTNKVIYVGNDYQEFLETIKDKGLEALKEIKDLFTCHDFDLLEKCSLIEKALKAKDNLVSMCENLAKLVGLKEKDYVELENLITKNLKALKVIIKTLDIRVSMNKMGQCFLEDNHCIYAIPRSTYDLLKEVLK